MVSTEATLSKRPNKLSGHIVAIGVPDQEMNRVVDNCYNDIQQWVKLMLHIFDSELPHWHIMRQFNCFQVTEYDFSARMSAEAMSVTNL